MCDNNKNSKSLISKDSVSLCHPCSNDTLGCRVSKIESVITRNLNVLNVYKNMKCAVISYINSVSAEFVQNIDYNEDSLERERFNVLIESLIAALHQSVRAYTDGYQDPHFHLWIQSDSLYDIGHGSIDPYNTEAYCSESLFTNESDCETILTDTNDENYESGNQCLESEGGAAYVRSDIVNTSDCVDSCSDDVSTTKEECESNSGVWTNRYLKNQWFTNGGEGACSDSQYETRDECLQNTDLFGNTNVWEAFDEGNLARLYPNKISLFTNCNLSNGLSTKGDEILYHYNPSVQLLYNPVDSSLYLKWSDAVFKQNATSTQKCIFPLLTNQDNFKSEVLVLVPPSLIPQDGSGNDIWEKQEYVYDFIRRKCLLENRDIHRFVNLCDTMIRKCELTNQSLRLKLQMTK